MKGDPRVLQVLNELLTEELTAISQYVVHGEMCDDWGYARLHKKVEERAIQEMKHAEKLIGRIIFLEGTPRVDKLNPIRIGADVPGQFANDLADEHKAVKSYNDAIRVCVEAGDAVSRELLEDIVEEEDEHVDWLEQQQEQIRQMGLAQYLAIQVRE